MLCSAGYICARVLPSLIGTSPMTLRKPKIKPPLISAGSSGKKISAKWEISCSCHFIFWRAAFLACSLSAELCPVVASRA